MHTLLGELALAVDRIFVWLILKHLDAFAPPGVLIAVLGDHIQLVKRKRRYSGALFQR